MPTRSRRVLGVVLLVLLLAGTGVWVALGSPRPHAPTVSPAHIVVSKTPAPSVTVYAKLALAVKHDHGRFPQSLTVDGKTVRVHNLGGGRARLCEAGACVIANSKTNKVST